ncbi:hypothetical protein PAHAL_7G153600 [Panicum hallii]|uniref:Uncharacterized protein n=1 Tax=Panicum hallii TaxID=206008 RepID=A0A2T8ICC8_9POAL|nr:hypothetical protein PAHAL_7G153600 [Panicum hallii]
MGAARRPLERGGAADSEKSGRFHHGASRLGFEGFWGGWCGGRALGFGGSGSRATAAAGAWVVVRKRALCLSRGGQWAPGAAPVSGLRRRLRGVWWRLVRRRAGAGAR